jgi:hypothetical protein
MSYATRRRAAGLAVAGVLVALPLFGSAALAAPDSQDVAFGGGGPGALLCSSTPATPSITVPADSKLRLTNNLGQAATLQIDGQDAASVAKGASVDVRFHRGPVLVAMAPQCPLNLNRSFKTLTVEVTPRTAAPAPPSTPVVTGGPRAGTSQAPADGKSSPRPTGASATTTTGDDDEAVVPVPSGDPLFPDEISALPASGVETPAGTEPPATVVNADGSQVQALTGREAPVDNGPIGLLAIIATVCVVGVSAGAIRAIIAQRATRFA